MMARIEMTETSSWKQKLFAGISALTLIGAAACARAADNPGKKADSKAAAKEAPKDAPKEAAKGGQTVQMKVTDKGFEPATVTVKKGEPVTLVITRMTDATCATDIVIDDYGINTKLPLNKAVTVTFTPKKAGDLKYGCAMGKMIGGVLKVQ
jgi:plastocyanin domain-containing protein